MSDAVAGVGTVFSRDPGSGFVAIAEINSIGGPSMTRETIDVTSLDSTGGYREFITGFRDAGEVTLSMNFTRATYELMKTDFESSTALDYKIALPDDDNTELTFDGLVTNLPLDVPMDDKITADVTIKISGQVTLASGV